ncbi:MAG: Crp/Fnr family transcriptional regulator [Geobacteraceae bacterium GWC2_48_7]|nr:MAG: Crp/Fnr family transcriptional regulator [Geobacteraceae bacterium GWC2_48_7]
MELIEQIKHSLLFSGLADNDLAELAAITVKRAFIRGEVLFRQNDEATGFYLLVSGSIRLSNVSDINRKKTFNFVSPGETFAEAAFYSNRKYQCEALALAPGEALYFPKIGFHKLIKRNPKPALNLLGHLSFIVRQLSRKFMERSQGDVASRLATFLVGRMAEQSTTSCGEVYLELGIKKSELASRLGVAQETISRSFKKLKDDGILEVQKNRVVIYQLEELKKLCEVNERQ